MSKLNIITVKEKSGVITAPGIGDDGRGLAVLLEVLRAVSANDFQTVGDILFVGTSGNAAQNRRHAKTVA